MKKRPNLSAVLAVGAIMLSLSFMTLGAKVTFAQMSGATTIGGSSVFTDPTTAAGNTTPTYPTTQTTPTTGGTTFPSGPTSSSPGSNLGSTSVYCSSVSSTILAASSNVGSVLKFFTCFIQSSIIPLLFMLALAVFVWGVVKFMMSQQSAEKEDGKQFMLWGIIALAVMFSVWGIVNIFQNTFQIKNAVPQLTVPSGS